jgi:hypothetical protein
MTGLDQNQTKGLWKIKNANDQLTAAAWALKGVLTDTETENINDISNQLEYLRNSIKERFPQ